MKSTIKSEMIYTAGIFMLCFANYLLDKNICYYFTMINGIAFVIRSFMMDFLNDKD